MFTDTDGKITVDGIEYTYNFMTNGHIVVANLFDVTKNLVASVEVDHNCEFIGVEYYDEDDEPITTTAPYFEFNEADDLMTWVASTNPIF